MKRSWSWNAAIIIFLSAVFPAVAGADATPALCHYECTVWNVRQRTSIVRRKVSKPYASLEARERGAEGCTPCVEDQTEIVLSNGLKFQACRRLAARFQNALEAALRSGAEIRTVVGYRAQMSRGPVDRDGNRTELSNHAFGQAVDINEASNGLYENCTVWSPQCHLRKGGAYRPGSSLSLTRDSPVVSEMKKAGFRWGGEIAGRQKDFMHFSLTGY